ncbi:MAG TPA: glycosyltransferase [Candidatus Binataceae bacterium]|nr:glycosyltransferase [Candidatus Binataceae bacterium]
MEVAFVTEFHPDRELPRQVPWNYFAADLASAGINIMRFDSLETAWRPFDAMILIIWLDPQNRRHFKPYKITSVMEKYWAYRARFPQTVQIVVNHTDMSRFASATPYWKPGDPVLFRTPAYDRDELWPFPAAAIYPWEKIWGTACYKTDLACKYDAGFIGRASGPDGYREQVARATAKVGIGKCVQTWLDKDHYAALMSQCRILVCPQGWGEQSRRHWEAWKSGKPVLTDSACDSVEMIPGIRLRRGVHYLVYDEPAEIPDIVSDWTRPGRRDDLEQIARNGQRAALDFDGKASMLKFFEGLSTRTLG